MKQIIWAVVAVIIW